MKKILCLALALILTLSFTAFASDFVFVSSSVENGATAVYAKEDKIYLTFNEEVTAATVSVKKGSAAFTEFIPSIDIMDNTKIVVDFDNDLEYGATYELDFSAATGVSGALTGEAKKITFTVEDAPVVDVTFASLLNGVGTGTINTTATTLTAGIATPQGWLVNIENNSAEIKDVVLFCGIYDSNGMLIKVVTSEKTIAAGDSDAIGLGTVIPATSASSVTVAGGKAKLFVWNNVTDRSPYVGAFEFAIQ